jgi:hypothetical protein
MRRIKTTIMTLSLLVGFAMPSLAVAAPVQVAALQSQSDACKGLNQLGGTSCSNDPTTSYGQNQIAAVAKVAVNIISFIAGIAAVILIVVSGVRFIASGGDSQAAASARSMLIYAIIGLVIVALAQAIVHFVLNAVLNHKVTQS